MGKVKKVRAHEILDSKGDPTVEVRLETDKGIFEGSCPSGVSTGEREAVEIRDGGSRFGGRGVKKAVENVNKIIASELEGKKIDSQKKFDELLISLDDTKNKSQLGANALLPVSITLARAGAFEKEKPLFEYLRSEFGIEKEKEYPVPCFLIFEGGLHAGGSLATQEFMVVFEEGQPVDQIEKGVSFYKKAGEKMRERFGPRVLNVGLEGGFTPPFAKTRDAVRELAGLLEGEGRIVLDVAASHLHNSKTGGYDFEGRSLTGEKLVDFYGELVSEFPLLGIEDPFDEDDFEVWRVLKKRVKETLLIGDDLTVTNKKRVREALEKDCLGGLVVKPNQVGTVTEAVETALFAKSKGVKLFVKHRSGETNDSFITDLAVALGADYLMAGAPTRGERVAKYNRLLEIV